MVTRHEVLTCFFVKEDDTFSRNERIAALFVTILNTWWVALIIANSDAMPAWLSSIVTAVFTAPFTALFMAFSRFQCCAIEWGRFITVPLALIHLFVAIIYTVMFSKLVPAAAYVFVGGLATGWTVRTPFGVVIRTWLYGMGWKKWIGIGRKSKWYGDKGVMTATGFG